ncbi:MAG: DUF3750 domain-containing protein [Rhodoblastus sp.]|nr:MAG: DUF3750 domain-containing protein [Rhodoblastus sp.]
MARMLKLVACAFGFLFVAPLAASAARFALSDAPSEWWRADRSSAGLVAPAHEVPQAAVRVLSARVVAWRGAFATHSWLLVKEAGAARWTRYDYTAWGEPILVDGFAPDGKWFGATPEIVFAADGEAAARAIPKIRAAVAAYRWRKIGDYRIWPGPNSNTFVAAMLEAAPELRARLPATAIGRDYPHDGRWLKGAGDGVALRLGGLFGAYVGRRGVELTLLGATAALDLRRPAVELPGLGRIGMRPL